MKQIINFTELPEVIKEIKHNKKTVVLAGGCFDILHQGHLEYLKSAKKEADILIVALENDQNVRRLKGPGRPVNKDKIRAQNLLGTGFVDFVLILPSLRTESDYLGLVKSVQPKIVAVTEGDPKLSAKQKQAKIVGTTVRIVTKRLSGFSTTNIINSI